MVSEFTALYIYVNDEAQLDGNPSRSSSVPGGGESVEPEPPAFNTREIAPGKSSRRCISPVAGLTPMESGYSI